MAKTIRFVYRKIIDSTSKGAWEKFVFEDSYAEYKMQSQLYNREKKHDSFKELIQQVPDAQKLHFLVSASVTVYMQQLNRIVPDIPNNNGKLFLPFNNFRFEIIDSAISNKAMHKVAIEFYSEPVCWHETIGDLFLVSLTKNEKGSGRDEELTEMVRLQPFFSIYSISTNQ